MSPDRCAVLLESETGKDGQYFGQRVNRLYALLGRRLSDAVVECRLDPLATIAHVLVVWNVVEQTASTTCANITNTIIMTTLESLRYN